MTEINNKYIIGQNALLPAIAKPFKTRIFIRRIRPCVIVVALAAVLLLSASSVFCPASVFTAYAAASPDTKVFDSDYDTNDGFAYGSGDGESEETAFLIATPEHLDNIRNYLGDAESDIWYYFKQIADIDLTDFLKDSEFGWQSIGTDNSIGEYFYGVYDGGLFEIKGLWCNRPQDVYTGLFGFAESSKIKNIRLSLSERGIVGGKIAGGIVSLISKTVIKNCSVKGMIKADVSYSSDTEELFAGGIAGQAINYSHIEYCYFSGSIIDSYVLASDAAEPADGIGSRGLGGITGYIKLSRITNCYADFSVIKDGEHDLCRASGGIAGVHGLDSVIENCLAVITANGQVFPITAGIIEGWLGFGVQPKLKINGSYAYYTGAAHTATDVLDVPDPRGLSKDEYTRVLSAEEISKRETYVGTNGIPWDFTTVWGFDAGGNILLRTFGKAYDPQVPPDLTWLWIMLGCTVFGVAAITAGIILYRRKKVEIVTVTNTITVTNTVSNTVEKEIVKESPINQGLPLPMELFTTAERRIAELLVLGKTRQEISETLNLGENTVKTHTRNIFAKTEVKNQKAFIVRYIYDSDYFEKK